MSLPEQNDKIEVTGATGVGALLKASRLRVGADLRDIAGILKIRYVYLEAIEDARFDELPGPTYATGFIRAYADHLGLDSGEVIRRFKMEVSDKETPVDLIFPEPIPEPGIPGGAIVLIGIVVAVVAYGVWYVNTSKEGFLVELVSPLPDRLARLSPDREKPEDAAPTAAQEEPKEAPAERAAGEETPEPAPPRETTRETPAETPAETAAAPEPEKAETPRESTVETTAETPAETPGESTVETTAETPAETAAAPDPEPLAMAPAGPSEGAASGASVPTPVEIYPPEPASPPEPATPVEIYPPEPASPPESAETSPAVATPPAPAERPEPPAEITAENTAEITAERPAEVAQTPETASLAATVSGTAAGQGRILIRAKANSWIQVRDETAGELLLTRLLRPGDSYAVPQRPGLKLSTGNAGALEILVDGEPVPSIGDVGMVRRKVALDAEKLKAGTAVSE